MIATLVLVLVIVAVAFFIISIVQDAAYDKTVVAGYWLFGSVCACAAAATIHFVNKKLTKK